MSEAMSPEAAEADRLMTICNACRYCEGLCAVFPAMEMRRAFAEGDLRHLANLCHNCGACYHDCQYAPPHEFAVNVPRALAKLRARSWADYAWPRPMARMFARNGVKVSTLAAVCVAGFLIAFMAASDLDVMFGVVTGQGAFYAIMPHAAMAWLFGAVFAFAVLALGMGVRNYWRDVEGGLGPQVGRADREGLRQGSQDAATLRYLDGGGLGCAGDDRSVQDERRLWHHLTFYGFLLCFASTSSATVMHYGFGWEAPYSWMSLPVFLGFWGGLGITVGPVMLMRAKRGREPEMRDETGAEGADAAFLHMLAGVGATGLLLLLLRETAAMGTLLAVHLGFVFAFFLAMPYGKFVHGIYRYAALVRHAMERRQGGVQE